MKALTSNQALLLSRFASGQSLRKIALEEYVSTKTVTRIFGTIRERLGVETNAQSCLVAYSLGYITLPDENGIVRAQSPFTEGGE